MQPILKNQAYAICCVATEIPGHEGKAGLLCIENSENKDIDLNDLLVEMKKQLPGEFFIFYFKNLSSNFFSIRHSIGDQNSRKN